MLSLASGSVCDVCLEPFGHEHKAPCSIQCGHVFCVGCLDHLTRASCPLCRQPFNQQSVIKLHVELDIERSSPRTKHPISNSEQEVRRLQEAITSITNEGTTEARLRQLIAECKTLLSGQPRHLYSDFRASYKMLAYLCEVKSTLRAHELSVEDMNKEIKQMTAEKVELERAISAIEAARREERGAALAAERNLRDHATRAHTAYQAMVDCYNEVMSECFKLREDVQRLQYPRAGTLPDSPPYSTGSPSSGSPTFVSKLSSGLGHKGLKDAAVAVPNSFLISPLPEFTRGLSSALDTFEPLPDIDEEGEGAPPPIKPFEPKVAGTSAGSSCGAAGHPYSCHCVSFSIFSDEEPMSVNERAKVVGDVMDTIDPTSSPPQIPMQSGLSLSVPKVHGSASRQDRARSRSSRSPSPSGSRESSRVPNRGTSPYLKSKRSQRSPSPERTVPLSHSHDSNMLRTRLHNILDTPISVSLPNFHVDHFPPGFIVESKSHREKLPSRSSSPSGPPPAHQNLRHQPSQSHMEYHPSDVHPSIPSTAPNPPARVSTASAAAQAMANAQKAEKERQRAEKEQRRQERGRERAEKDRLKAESKGVSSSSASHQQTSAASTTSSNLHYSNLNGSSNNLGIYSSTGLTGSSPMPRRNSTSKTVRPGSSGNREGNQVPMHQQHQRYGKPLVPSNASSVSLQVQGPSYA